MRFADAMRCQHAVAPSRRVRLLANVTTIGLEVYLRAHGAVDGLGYDLDPCGYGQLDLALRELPTDTGAVAAVVIVVVEDVFPELGYRRTEAWSRSSLDAMEAEAASRIVEFVDALVAATASWGRRVVVVPPVLDAAPLLGDRGHLAAIQSALLAADGLCVVAPGAVVDGLANADLRDDDALLATGNPFSLVALDRIAAAVHARLAAPGEPRKVLATDLDGTMWNGVLVEDGIDALSAGTGHFPGYQAFLRVLKDEGVLLAVCSRNDRDEVVAVLDDSEARQRIGLQLELDDFASIRCGWTAKSTLLEAIADDLGVLPASIVLVDDNPADLEEVAAALPAVRGLLCRGPADVHRLVTDLRDAFPRRALSDEDRSRTALYVRRRQALEDRARCASPEDYLRSLDMRASFGPVGPDELDRALQLVNRTNQFNLLGTRLSRADGARLLADEGRAVVRGELADRYGPLGLVLVGVVADRGEEVVVEELAVSCRVFGRQLERAFLGWLVAERGRSPARIRVRWQPTGRNEVARQFLETERFETVGDGWHERRAPFDFTAHAIEVVAA